MPEGGAGLPEARSPQHLPLSLKHPIQRHTPFCPNKSNQRKRISMSNPIPLRISATPLLTFLFLNLGTYHYELPP